MSTSVTDKLLDDMNSIPLADDDPQGRKACVPCLRPTFYNFSIAYFHYNLFLDIFYFSKKYLILALDRNILAFAI